MTSLTFYGGVSEIGGNKILLEDKGTKVFLDFGMQMGRSNMYFAEFLNPRKLNGMGDLFEFGLLPDIKGMYRRDYSRHMGYGDHNMETSIDAVLLSHAHVDHCAYIHYLRPEIPIYCSEASRLIMQCFEETGGHEEYITYKENFQTYKNRRGGYGRADTAEQRTKTARAIRVMEPGRILKIDSISVEPIPIDHSLPGVYGFLIHTSESDIGYTADIRFHGRRPQESQNFVDRCGMDSLDCLLCEGTRIDKQNSITELDVETQVRQAIDETQNLVVCTYPTRDLDRFLSFYNAVRDAGRQLLIDTKQAYLLKLFWDSGKWRDIFPSPTDPYLRIFVSRKSWGLLGRDADAWPANIIEQDYARWERKFLDYPNMVNYEHVRNNQRDCVFYCSDYKLQDLIDVRPDEHSSYIRSSTEPFDDEMKLDQERVKHWLVHFGMLSRNQDMKPIHVSGHGSGDQIRRVIDGAGPAEVIPIHTEHEDHFENMHDAIRKVGLGQTVQVGHTQ